jgi:hypothetical protein
VSTYRATLKKDQSIVCCPATFGSLRRLLTKSIMIINSLINLTYMAKPWTEEERDVLAPSVPAPCWPASTAWAAA